MANDMFGIFKLTPRPSGFYKETSGIFPGARGVILLMEEILHQLTGTRSLSHYLEDFLHPRCRISSINSTSDLGEDAKAEFTLTFSRAVQASERRGLSAKSKDDGFGELDKFFESFSVLFFDLQRRRKWRNETKEDLLYVLSMSPPKYIRYYSQV